MCGLFTLITQRENASGIRTIFPDTVPLEYTASDIANTTRGYIDDTQPSQAKAKMG